MIRYNNYLPKQRHEYICQTDVKTQKASNIHIHRGVQKQDFVKMRQQRDATLKMPKLILPSIQINMDAGRFPEPESNGVRYLKLPFNFF